MRAVIQRVSNASVTIAGQVKSSIGPGLLVLLSVEEADIDEDIEWLSSKTVRLRIFADENGAMNKSVQDVGGDILVVSQFTLFASTKKGNRPAFSRAAAAETASRLYERFVQQLTQHFGKEVLTGEFGADMQVNLINDGPVTIWIDTKTKE